MKLYSPKVDHHHISAIDQFLAEFNRTHALTASQQQEKQKHQRIARQRDEIIEAPADVL